MQALYVPPSTSRCKATSWWKSDSSWRPRLPLSSVSIGSIFTTVVAAARPGDASHRPADFEWDPQVSLAEQFEFLRVVDNVHYLSFFDWRGRRYRVVTSLELLRSF